MTESTRIVIKTSELILVKYMRSVLLSNEDMPRFSSPSRPVCIVSPGSYSGTKIGSKVGIGCGSTGWASFSSSAATYSGVRCST